MRIEVLFFALVVGILPWPSQAQNSTAQAQSPPPPPPVVGLPAVAPYLNKPLSLDIARLRRTHGVRDAVLDSSNSQLTVLFTNGDVLLAASSESGSAVTTRLLVTHANLLTTDEDWREKIKLVAGLVLSPLNAKRVDQSLGSAVFEQRSGGAMSIDSGSATQPEYGGTISGMQLDGLGRSMSIVYRRL